MSTLWFKKKNKIKMLIIFLIVLLFSCGSGGTIYLYHSTADIRIMIDDLGEITRTSQGELSQIEAELANYSDIQWKFISNLSTYYKAKATFEAIPDPITLTLQNVKDYVNFDLSLENFGCTTSKDIFGFTHYYCTVNLTIRCSSKTSGTFENTSVTVEIDDSKISYLEQLLLGSSSTITLSLDGNGAGETTKILSCDYAILPDPTFRLSSTNIQIKTSSGKFYPTN